MQSNNADSHDESHKVKFLVHFPSAKPETQGLNLYSLLYVSQLCNVD